ncbi:hypothetical protein [Methanococcus voltae]|uniref:Glucan phosphoethanolaminetransferase (Alkaline phosphatase superfamily) n=1 Tax=Methanococcus voltae TaxID=2188 RepID=A0A8J7UQV4_METVO|nr:hypothetical protein [Methanococcus voltae]MBP2171912.1 glucan phosphoethanolaminetransferase (alkaline phosphatase superfamily) [Methanococcus voltae]MBP2201133.1 glucan phosphoethanolaminetransferase (alkaline phosphatase superfamily) [Methanococcus voltae]
MNTFEIIAGLSAVFIIIIFLIGLILQIVLTYLGVKLAKIDTNLANITKVSLIKYIIGIIISYVPLGIFISYIVSVYINKRYFNTSWKKGLIVELPSLILGVIIIILAIVALVYSGQDIYSATMELLY